MILILHRQNPMWNVIKTLYPIYLSVYRPTCLSGIYKDLDVFYYYIPRIKNVR